MHEDWVVCAFVSLGEAQLFIGERVDPVLVDEPVERATGHIQEPSAVGVVSFQATRAPERYRARGHEFRVAEHVCNDAFGGSVDVSGVT